MFRSKKKESKDKEYAVKLRDLHNGMYLEDVFGRSGIVIYIDARIRFTGNIIYKVSISFKEGTGVEYKDLPGDYIIRGIKIKEEYNEEISSEIDANGIYIKDSEGHTYYAIRKEREEKTMEKRDLRELIKDGDIVTLRNGDRLFYYSNGFDDLNDDYSNNLTIISDLDVNLNYISHTFSGHKKSDSDVIKIERPILTTTIWEREEKEPVEMTLEEVCEKLGYDVKIVKKGEE